MLTVKQRETSEGARTSYLCTCGKETPFKGVNCPLVCGNCSELIPDASNISKESLLRVIFHLDKEIFV